jgi:TonB family protein
MSLELEDYKPEAPRVLRAISVREGVLMSLIVHLVMVVVVLLSPKLFHTLVPVEPPPPITTQVEFVPRDVLKDVIAPPSRAPRSSVDRHMTTIEKAPAPDSSAPVSHSDAEKTQATPPDPPLEPPVSMPPIAPPDVASKITNPTPAPQANSGNAIGDALRHIDRYTTGQSFADDQGRDAKQQAADIQFDPKGVDFSSWIRRFRAQVIRNWWVPQAAQLMSGHVVIQFYVHRDGRITDLHVVEPSKIESFTTAAYNALKLSNPTAQLPPEYPDESVLFTVKFFYNEIIR